MVGLLAMALGAFLLWLCWRPIQRMVRDDAVSSGVLASSAVLLLVGLVALYRGMRYAGLVPAGLLARPPARRLFGALASLAVPGLGQLCAGRNRRGLAFLLAFVILVVAGSMGLFGAGANAGPYFVVALATLGVRLASSIDATGLEMASFESLPWYRRWYGAITLAVAFTALLTISVSTFARARTFRLPSGNMEPTILVGDRFRAELGSPGSSPPALGSIVLFQSPEEAGTTVVSRVVGLPGDLVEIRDKVMFRNGEQAVEPWVSHRDHRMYREGEAWAVTRDQMAPQRVPAGHFLALGDSRDASYDSRYFGPVPQESIRGIASFVVWSQERSRIGRSLRTPER